MIVQDCRRSLCIHGQRLTAGIPSSLALHSRCWLRAILHALLRQRKFAKLQLPPAMAIMSRKAPRTKDPIVTLAGMLSLLVLVTNCAKNPSYISMNETKSDFDMGDGSSFE